MSAAPEPINPRGYWKKCHTCETIIKCETYLSEMVSSETLAADDEILSLIPFTSTPNTFHKYI